MAWLYIVLVETVVLIRGMQGDSVNFEASVALAALEASLSTKRAADMEVALE
jgi:hypothetical protein